MREIKPKNIFEGPLKLILIFFVTRQKFHKIKYGIDLKIPDPKKVADDLQNSEVVVNKNHDLVFNYRQGRQLLRQYVVISNIFEDLLIKNFVFKSLVNMFLFMDDFEKFWFLFNWHLNQSLVLHYYSITQVRLEGAKHIFNVVVCVITLTFLLHLSFLYSSQRFFNSPVLVTSCYSKFLLPLLLLALFSCLNDLIKKILSLVVLKYFQLFK